MDADELKGALKSTVSTALRQPRRHSLSLLWVVLLINLACNVPSLVVTPADVLDRVDSTVSPSRSGFTPAPPSLTGQEATSIVEMTPAPFHTSITPTAVESLTGMLATCPTTEEIERFHVDFDIFFDPVVDLPAYAREEANPQLAVYQALRAMSALRFDQPLPWTSHSLYDWLRGAISGIVLTSTDISYCCDIRNRIVLKADLLSQPSYSTWYEPQTGIGLMSLVGLIVHEARHTEIGGYTCDGSDDLSLKEIGAWGIQY